jgi:hypothetical protein
MKKFILIVAAVALSVPASFAQSDVKMADSKSATVKTGPAIKFEKEVYDFGTIKQGQKVEYAYTFTSTGNEPLIISQAQGSCGCTVPEWPKHPMKKGEKGTIKVTFDSTGKLGLQDKTITITSNASDAPVVLHIKGTIVAADGSAPADTKPAHQHNH